MWLRISYRCAIIQPSNIAADSFKDFKNNGNNNNKLKLIEVKNNILKCI